MNTEVEVDGKKLRGLSGGGFPPRSYRAVQAQTGTRRDGKPGINGYREIEPEWREA